MYQQGAGSDVGASVVLRGPGQEGAWRLFGDKWFCSNTDAALAMVSARPADAASGTKGLALFLLPRTLPEGAPNTYRIIRLKDKLGTRSMASGEIRLEGATAYLVGDLGAGFRQMADMINNSRLSNGVRSAGLMRRAVTEALFHRPSPRRIRQAPGGNATDAARENVGLGGTARTMMFQTAEALRRADAGEPGASTCCASSRR